MGDSRIYEIYSETNEKMNEYHFPDLSHHLAQ